MAVYNYLRPQSPFLVAAVLAVVFALMSSSASASGTSTISCATTDQSIKVSLHPEGEVISWEVAAQHSSGNPRYVKTIGRPWTEEQLEILSGDDLDAMQEVLAEGPAGELPLTHLFGGDTVQSFPQGIWNVSASTRSRGQAEGDWTTLSAITCTVAGGL